MPTVLLVEDDEALGGQLQAQIQAMGLEAIWWRRGHDIHPDMPPPVDLVVLTHEHNDHVDLASLQRLPPDVPVLVAPLMPAVVVRAVERLGCRVHRARPGDALGAGPLSVELLPGAAAAPVGEGRVAQVLLTADGPGGPATVLVGVDTPISQDTLRRIRSAELPAPDLVVVANNTQLPPAGVWGAGCNLLQPHPTRSYTGLDLLQTLCLDYLDGLPGTPAVALCGGGFFDDHELGVPYAHDDHPALAAQATQLGLVGAVLGPLPGERVLVPGGGAVPRLAPEAEPAVCLDRATLARRRAASPTPGLRPLRPVRPPLDPAASAAALARVDAWLAQLAPVLLADALGEAVIGCQQHAGRWCGAQRLAVRLVDLPDGGSRCHVLDLVAARFVPHEGGDPQADTRRWPVGLHVALQDLDALIAGELVIWDVLGLAVRHWSATDADLPTFLCRVLGEAARPEATAVALAARLTSLGVPTAPDALWPGPESPGERAASAHIGSVDGEIPH